MSTVLVVDDEYITHRIINVILGNQGLTIASAYNGLEALEYLKRHQVDLILSDIQMPLMNGIEMIECIRSISAYQDLPIVLISASPDPEISIEGLKKGANFFLSQPFSSWELNRIVADFLIKYARLQAAQTPSAFDQNAYAPPSKNASKPQSGAGSDKNRAA